MKRKYAHPESHNLSGKAFGLPPIDRLSELSLQSARAIEWHSHDETEIICCLKGSLRYEFRKRLDATLASGCFLVIPSGHTHRLADGIDGPCRRISFFLQDRPTALGPTTPFTRAEYRDMISDILKKRFRPRSYPPSLRQYLTRIANLVQTGTLTPKERVELRTASAAAIFSFSTAKPSDVPKPQVRLIGESVKWLHAHFQEKVSLAQMSAFMGYSQSRFCELFKDHTGLPPMEWLIRYRIEKACELLKTGSDAVSDIARKVGFDDPLFFSRVFRKRTGASPKDYRENAFITPPVRQGAGGSARNPSR